MLVIGLMIITAFENAQAQNNMNIKAALTQLNTKEHIQSTGSHFIEAVSAVLSAVHQELLNLARASKGR